MPGYILFLISILHLQPTLESLSQRRGFRFLKSIGHRAWGIGQGAKEMGNER